jgi:hypothetical protein
MYIQVLSSKEISMILYGLQGMHSFQTGDILLYYEVSYFFKTKNFYDSEHPEN